MRYAINILKYFHQDSLYRNSLYLMTSTAVLSFFGFFFWIICARFYNTQSVGIATTLISIVGLISNFSLLGFSAGFIRFIPTSINKDELINSCINLVTALSIIISIFYIFSVYLLSPKLVIIRQNFFYSFSFLLIIIFTSLNIILESIFIAYRSSKYVLMKNIFFSLVKLSLPIFFLTLDGYGIFISVGIATILSFIFSVRLLTINYGYKWQFIINFNAIKQIIKFSLGNYASSFIILLPTFILPILITNKIGPEFTAYYYIPMMIANFIFIIPQATTRSLFAEGSHNKLNIKTQIRKSFFISFILILPTLFIIHLLGEYILHFFGDIYVNEGIIFLKIISLSVIFIFFNSLGNVLLNLEHKIKELIIINLINSLSIIFISYLLLKFQLIGISIGWILGNFITSCIFVYIYLKLTNENS